MRKRTAESVQNFALRVAGGDKFEKGFGVRYGGIKRAKMPFLAGIDTLNLRIVRGFGALLRLNFVLQGLFGALAWIGSGRWRSPGLRLAPEAVALGDLASINPELHFARKALRRA
jgi:hypothetical protein